MSQHIPYRRKFSRHEKFTKSLKTGFSRLFIRETIKRSSPGGIILRTLYCWCMNCSRLYVRDAGTIREIRENFMPRKFPPIRYCWQAYEKRGWQQLGS